MSGPMSSGNGSPHAAGTSAATAPAILAAERVRVRSGGSTAVRDVSMTLRGRAVPGLCGPNGSGKTTLLRALAAIQPLTRGVVRVLGEPLGAGDNDVRRHV